MIDLIRSRSGTWVFTGLEGESYHANPETGVELVPIYMPTQWREAHYDRISIGLFLKLFHYSLSASASPGWQGRLAKDWSIYREVNELFAERAAAHARPTDECILLNDPHLMLTGSFLRQAHVQKRIVTFLGTPWPQADYFSLLPRVIRDELLRALLTSDTIGFHSSRWSKAFQECCEQHLPEAKIQDGAVSLRGRNVQIVSSPFPLDTAILDDLANSQLVHEAQAMMLKTAAGRFLITRADRVDFWKNIPRFLMAVQTLLEEQPEIAKKVWFLLICTPPSRANSEQLDIDREARALAANINCRWGSDRFDDVVSIWSPDTGNASRASVVASLTLAKAAVVNSTFDGLNLYAKEALYLLPDGSSVLLSTNAGAFDEVGHLTTPLDPFDITQLAGLMADVLAGRSTGIARDVRRNQLGSNSSRWLESL